MQFADVTNDIAFRKIFGDENKKVILISFLNAVLQLEGNRRIGQISINNPFQLPILPNHKASIIDIKATDEKGKIYLIEMQVVGVLGMDNRILYYASKEYSGQMLSGEKYQDLHPVIFIGVFNFNFTPRQKYLSHHAVCDVDTGDRIIEGMDFFFIELPKFNVPPGELQTVTDKWIYFIKQAKNLAVVPDNLNDEGLREAYQYANIQSWTKSELEEYDRDVKFECDERGKLDYAKETGKHERELEIAQALKAAGSPVDFIAQITGLPKEQIEKL